MVWLIIAILFVLGCCIGSFINAAEYRLAAGEGVVRGRSHCRNCSYTLAWYDLAPLLSFVILAGKCRSCKRAISWQYPAVELVTGLLFVAAYFLQRPAIEALQTAVLIRDLLVVSVAVFLFVYDYKYSLLPDAVTLPGIIIFAASSLVFGMPWAAVLIGILFGGGFFLLQYLVSRGKWVGDGDIRYGAMIGGLFGWPAVLVALFLSYIFGAVFGVGLLLSGRKQPGDAIPFGTFLSIGMLVTLWWGPALVAWYAQWL